MIDKKGVGVNQVFIYIIAMITFALIMIFGFKAIVGFTRDVQKIEFTQFKSDLENSVEQLHSEFGAAGTEEFFARAFQQICFIDLDYFVSRDAAGTIYTPTPGDLQPLCELDQRACVVWKESKGYNLENENVFLTLTGGSANAGVEIPRIKVSRIELENGFLCVPIRNGRFSLILEGRGDRTKISGLS